MNEENPFKEEERNFPEDYVSGEEYREKLAEFQPAEDKQFIKQTTWKQKLAVVFLIVFGIAALVLWAAQFSQGLIINPPLPPEQPAEPQANLQELDTDKDGLSDYDELYFYNTSPYIEDSDSDGVSDKAEIDAEQDPNCPLGQNCFSGDEILSNETPAPNFDLNAPGPLNSPVVGPSQEDVVKILSGEVDAATLRAFLRDAGMNQEMLDQISDEDLIANYQQTLEGQE
ncbi:MAG: hypothetical protein Q8Q23_04980 [bacterium]|nr:hypothetical protein [bacterium]